MKKLNTCQRECGGTRLPPWPPSSVTKTAGIFVCVTQPYRLKVDVKHRVGAVEGVGRDGHGRAVEGDGDGRDLARAGGGVGQMLGPSTYMDTKESVIKPSFRELGGI